MRPQTFKSFYDAIGTPAKRSEFKRLFLKQTERSASSFDNYKKVGILKEIPYMYANKIKELANILFPDISHLLNESEVIN